jgi:hypothetical protein
MVYSLPNWTGNAGGIEVLMAEGSRQYPGFAMGILAFIYIVILGAGYFAQDRKVGAGNMAGWASVSGLITTTLSFILFLYDNIVSIDVVITFMIISILTALIFLITNRE